MKKRGERRWGGRKYRRSEGDMKKRGERGDGEGEKRYRGR